MFNYIWASPSRDSPVMDYEFFTKPDASGAATGNRNESSLSLAIEGLAAPTLMQESSAETATSSAPAISQPASARCYLRRRPDGQLHAEPVMKDYRQRIEVQEENSREDYILGAYTDWNRQPVETSAAAIKQQQLCSSDGTLSCDPLAVTTSEDEEASTDCGCSTMENSGIYDGEDLLDVPISPPSEHSPPNMYTLARMLEASQSKTPSLISVLALDEANPSERSTSASTEASKASKGSEDSGISGIPFLPLTQKRPHGPREYQPLSSEDSGHSHENTGIASEGRAQSAALFPMPPPPSPVADHKGQRVDDTSTQDVVHCNHPSVAREQYQKGAGVLWESARYILQSHFLHPADLTETEFTALVCSEGLGTTEWLEENVLPISGRSIRRWMDSSQLLKETGIQRPFVSDEFFEAFQYMSDEEQALCLRRCQTVQLRTVARLQKIMLTHGDEESFLRLPVTARASFIKQYLGVAPEGEYQIDPTIWAINLGEYSGHDDSLSDAVLQPSFSIYSEDSDSWVEEALKKREAPPLPPRPVRSDPDITMEHVEHVEIGTSGLPAPSNTQGDESLSPVQANSDVEDVMMPCSCTLRTPPAKSRTGLAHEYRALEIRTKTPIEIPAGMSQKAASQIAKQDSNDLDGLSSAAMKTPIRPGNETVRQSDNPQRVLPSCHQLEPVDIPQEYLHLDTYGIYDVPTPIKAIPTPHSVPRKASEYQRPLTPIPDTTPYKRRSVHFDTSASSASTASINTVMLGITKTGKSKYFGRYPGAEDSDDDDLYSIFDAKFDAYTDDDSTASNSQKSFDDSSSRNRKLGLRLRRAVSTATLRLKSVVAEKEERKPQTPHQTHSLRNKLSRVWGSVSLRARVGRGTFEADGK